MSDTPIKALGEIALRVNNLGPMVEFYQNVIGLKLMRKSEQFAFFEIAKGYAGHTQVIALFDRTGPQSDDAGPDSKKTSLDHIAFTIANEDFDAEDQRIQALGLVPTYAYHEWVQWRSLYVKDPEGNTVELVCHAPQHDDSA